MPVFLDMFSFLNELFRKRVRRYFFRHKSHFSIEMFLAHCDCAAQQQQWFLFDPLHAYAEYIIDYEYLFSVRIRSIRRFSS